MKKVLIISSVLAVLALCATLYFLFTGKTTLPEETIPDVATTSAPVVTETLRGTGSLTALLALGRPLECFITYKGGGVGEPVTGTYFTSGGMLRGDFIVPEMATGSLSSLIVRDNTLYTWSVIDTQSYGMKVDLATLEAAKQSETAPDTNEPVPLEATVAYECKPWITVDKSVFETPTDVLFTNYADIMNMGMEFGTIYGETPTTDVQSQCELCKKIEGEARKVCLAQFACE